jgi:hypothetical protein
VSGCDHLTSLATAQTVTGATTIVVARLDRAIQYSRDISD